ncbi:MAG: glycosyltransferase N-terminal domain-containing protein [Ignavibacteria bacterium]
MNIWYLVYNAVFIPIFYGAMQFAGLFNAKIKKGIRDRRLLFDNLAESVSKLDKREKLIWFHSSSMGEFEQAKPIIQKIRAERNVNIIVTFFSPSGYENSKKYPFADIISYIPFDSPALSRKFLQLVKPDIAIMIRYDIWPNFIWQLKERNIPCFIVDATMRGDSKRKLPFIKDFHKELFKNFTKILTVSETDLTNFRDFDIHNGQLNSVGDTRFDRVLQKSQDAKEKKLFKIDFFKGKKVLVAGSSWEADEDVLLPAFLKLAKYDEDIILIIAPHEPTIQHLEKLENEFAGENNSIRFSYLNEYSGERIIIIDSIGILLTLYYYADVAYVGGSFKQGIHNVLEPAVYGIPVIFGPMIETSQEAQKLVELGAAKIVRDKKETYKILRALFSNDELRQSMGKCSVQYVSQNVGATDKIVKEVYNILFKAV